MELRNLSSEEITELKCRKNVSAKDVESFLSSLEGVNHSDAVANMIKLANKLKWNVATLAAITAGLLKACKKSQGSD